jgi:hypothetical protein
MANGVHISMNELNSFEKMSEQERKDRAFFMTTQLARHCSELLTEWLTSCKSESNGTGPVELEIRKEAIKELCTLSLWLCLTQQSDEVGRTAWLEEFFRLSWSAAEHILDMPPVADVFKIYPPALDREQLCLTAALNIAHRMHLSTSNEAIFSIQQSLMEAKADRATLLKEALTAPHPDLERLVSEPLPMVIG